MGMHRSVLAKQKGADMNNEAKISDVVEDMEHLIRLKDRIRENPTRHEKKLMKIIGIQIKIKIMSRHPPD